MSRCFPFPPPGYVKEDRADEVEVLPKEEKHKEKKHKKEKKDKKREGKEKKDKEKKDKDRSKDKGKEKKDRKEKHRDKKKDKDKGKSADERTGGRPEGHDAGEPSERQTTEIRQKPDEIKDSKAVEDLGRRIGDEERRTRNQMVENFIGSEQRRSVGVSGLVEKNTGNIGDRKNSSSSKKEKPSKLSQQPGEIKDSRYVEELGRRIGDDEGSTRNRMAENFIGSDPSRSEGMGRLVEKVTDNRSERENSINYKKGKQREINQLPHEIKDSRFVEDLGRRIEDEGMGRLVEKDIDNRSERRNINNYKKMDDKKADLHRFRDVDGVTGNTTVQNFIGIDLKRAEVLRDVDGATGTTVVQNFTGIDHNRADVLGRVLEKKGFDNRNDGKDINNGKSLHDKNADSQRGRIEDGGAQIPLVQKVAGVDQGRIGSMARLMDESVEGKEKNKSVRKEKKKSKSLDDKSGDKHKSREKKSKRKEKDVDKEKEKHKKDKSKEKSDHKNNKQEKLRIGSKDSSSTLSLNPPEIPKGIDNTTATEGNSRKRKDVEANGFLHDDDIRPNKLLKTTVSSNSLLLENGRKLEPFQIATRCAPDTHELGNNLKADNKEHKVNGIVEAPGSSNIPTKPPVANVHISENGGSSTKPPPHPDSKYLSQILSVPKMEEWSDFDDQEWLFSSNDSKKSNVASSGAEERPVVWAEAMQIESADICALPYVIPY